MATPVTARIRAITTAMVTGRSTTSVPRFTARTKRICCTRGEHVHDHADQDQGGAGPQREARGMQSQGMLAEFHFAQEQAEARHHEAESHQRQAGADPREKRPLGGQVYARVFHL